MYTVKSILLKRKKSPEGDLKLVEKGGNMSNFFVEDLERFLIVKPYVH